MSAGKGKFDARWKEGVWLGVRAESGESLIGTDEGVANARDFRRNAENGGRWSSIDFDKFVGAHWEPCPGAKGGFELRSKVRRPAERAEFTEIVKGKMRFYEEQIPITKRGLGDVRVCSRSPRVESGEQRHDSDEPFEGAQKKVRRRIGESWR